MGRKYPRTVPLPVITSWSGYKIDATTAEVIITGRNFGFEPGGVRLRGSVSGLFRGVVKLWSDDVIIVDAPADEEILAALVMAPGPRGFGRRNTSTRSHEVSRRIGSVSTQDPVAPTWTVSSIVASSEEITITGTNLDLVSTVLLFDDDVPQAVYPASFTVTGGGTEASIDWPAAFSGAIERLRLINADATVVDEHIAPVGGWQPAPVPLIEDWNVAIDGGATVINTFGIGFGSTEGTAELQEQGGSLQPASILSGSWSDTQVTLIADPNTTYDDVKITSDAGIESTTSPLRPATVTTPNLTTDLLTITNPAPGDWVITGTLLTGVRSLIIAEGPPNFTQHGNALHNPVFFPNGANITNLVITDGQWSWSDSGGAAGVNPGDSVGRVVALGFTGSPVDVLDLATPIIAT